MKKILSIGNSFSEDATRYLEAMAGGELFVRNCYIGGCSLKMHYDNIVADAAAYDYQKDGEGLHKIALSDALTREKWDYVTVQQVSAQSGIYDTYEPYLCELIAYIKEKCPTAEILFHRTWPYEVGSSNPGFVNYGCDRDAMYEAIVRTTDRVATHYGLPIIGAGDAVYKAAKLSAFDVANGGVSLYRDTFHLGWEYGRYLAALCWYRFFTGKSAETVTLVPENTDPAKLDVLKAFVG